MELDDDDVRFLLGRRLHPEARGRLTQLAITLDPEVARHLDGLLRTLVREFAGSDDQEFWLGEAFEHLRSAAIELALLEWLHEQDPPSPARAA